MFHCYGDINDIELFIFNALYLIFHFFVLALLFSKHLFAPCPSPLSENLHLRSMIQPPAPVPEPLTGVPWVSSSVQCSPVCSPSCSSDCAVSVMHVPEPLQSEKEKGNKSIFLNP